MKDYQDGWTIRLITRPGLRERLEPPASVDELLAPPGTACFSLNHGLADRTSAIQCLKLTVENELEALNYIESKSEDRSESIMQLHKRQRAYLNTAKNLVEQALRSC